MAEIKIVPDSIELIKLTDEEYFSEKYRDYISNTRLGLINPDEDGSEEKFSIGLKSSFSESYELGSAVHAMVLQQNSYFISKCDKPTGKLGIFAEEVFQLRNNSDQVPTLKEAIQIASDKADYYAGKLSDTRLKTAIKNSFKYYLDRIKVIEVIEDKVPIYLSKPIKEKYVSIMENITSSKILLNKLQPYGLISPPDYFNEYAILCEADVTLDNGIIVRVKLKAKLDNFTLDHELQELTLNDLKTTGKPVKFFMGNRVKVMDEDGKEETTVWYDGSFQKYHYYRQLGMYIWLLQAAITQYYGFKYKLKANMLVIETIPNFSSKIFPVNGEYIQLGLKEFKRLLILAAEWKNKTQII